MTPNPQHPATARDYALNALIGYGTLAVCVAALALIGGCAGAPLEDDAPTRADARCTAWHTQARVQDGKVYIERGACKAWAIGGTTEQRARLLRDLHRQGLER
jgi:hypothetical protein